MRHAAIWWVTVAAVAVELATVPVVQAAESTTQTMQQNQWVAVIDFTSAPSDHRFVAEVPLRLPSRRPNRSTDPARRAPDVQSSPEAEVFKYRLIVVGSSDTLLRQVRQVIPDAFRTTVDGRRVIQAGLFVEQQEAEAVRQQLERFNAETRLLDVDQVALVGRSSSSARSTSAVTNSNRRTGFQYRLIVQGSSDSLLRQVRQIVPDAFRTIIDGRRVIQAGLFVEQQEAEVVERELAPISTEKSILDINYGVASTRASTQSLPRIQSGKIVVVVDPGHGGRDPGAVGIDGIYESDIVLDIARRVATLIENEGIQAVLTRSDDREVELEPRVDLSDAVNADLFVSIHANAISMSRPDVNGIETYYYYSSTAEQLAETIHNSLLNATGMNDRGVRQARFYVLTATSMPAVLVEVGFVTGREDAPRLSSSSFRGQIAEAIAAGILRYVQQRL